MRKLFALCSAALGLLAPVSVPHAQGAAPLHITCPPSLTNWVCGSAGVALVNYPTPAITSDCTLPSVVNCTPASGGVFPLGVTIVTCVATDGCRATASCQFTVSVLVPRISIAAGPGGMTLQWPAHVALEEADTATGPWRLDPDATSPHLISKARAQRFFRAVFLDTGNGTNTFCPDTARINPRLADVLSRMHYASIPEGEEFEEEEDVSPHPITVTFPPRVPPYDPRPGAGFSWNSAAGRRLMVSVGEVGSDHEGAMSHAPGSVESKILQGVDVPTCVEPDFYVKAPDRTFMGWPQSNGLPTAVFRAPGDAFATKAQAEAFLLKIHAEEPFLHPFTDSSVRQGSGWYYSPGKLHRACDYSRTGVAQNADPTFQVTSAGNGVVVATDWDDNGGNYVAVESTAPGGQKVMFLYLHLRDGRNHDLVKARSSTSPSDKYVRYRTFATNFPNHISWGTDNHTIKVKAGDPVNVGTPLAWAGNTGAGGAGGGLNTNGSPKDWRGNLHLHVYVAVPHPTEQNIWVWVDPYGVYGEVASGCYDLLKDTKFSRLYAPFYPTFSGVPFEVFAYYWGYYPNMGLKLRTLSIHRDGNSLLASGSFQSGISGGWHFQAYRTPADFQAFASDYYANGFIMRETTVEKTQGGQPRYTAIWRPLEPGEQIEHRLDLTDAQWAALWQDRVIGDHWSLEDYFGYSVDGVNRHSVLLTSQGLSFHFPGPLTSAAFEQAGEDFGNDGFLPVSFNAASLTGGLRFTGIFRDVPGCWKASWGHSPGGYNTYVNQQSQLGYRVWKVQGYSNSDRYGVILRDPTGPCQ